MCLLRFATRVDGVGGLAFASDGRTLIAEAGANGTSTVYFWRIETRGHNAADAGAAIAHPGELHVSNSPAVCRAAPLPAFESL